MTPDEFTDWKADRRTKEVKAASEERLKSAYGQLFGFCERMSPDTMGKAAYWMGYIRGAESVFAEPDLSESEE